MKRKIWLEDFDVNKETGFLPANDPNPKMEYGIWGSTARNLPKLLMTGQIRKIIENIECDWTLRSISDDNLEEVMQYLSYLGHAYVWGEEGTVDKIPASIARPWFMIACALERPPILSYASYALHNWKRLDVNEPITLNNIVLLQNFLGGKDEEWFILIHVAIEASAGEIIHNLIRAHNFINMEKNVEERAIVEYIRNAEIGLKKMYDILARMPEHCDPYIFYHRVRPYIHGWMSKDPEFPYPEGIEYEGVNVWAGQKMQFRGETGAQSAIIPLLDALFSIEHKNDILKEYLLEMRFYLPKGHRKLIQEVEKYPCIREYTKKAPDAKKAMNSCIKIMKDFRTLHLEFAATYIHKQGSTGGTNSTVVGTGGTPFMKYLKKHKDETK